MSKGNKLKNVDVFLPCFVDQCYPQTGWNMIKVLEFLGCKVNYPEKQTCCGQPAYNAGFFDEAATVATKFLSDFPKEKYIIMPSASCVGMVRNGYGTLFKQSSHVLEYKRVSKYTYEFTEFLTEVMHLDKLPGSKFPHKVTYHDSCSGIRECGIKQGPRKLLSNVEGIELIEMNGTETCCGFGGTFSVKFDSISTAMTEQKVNNALETGAEYIVSTDWSCLMTMDAYIQKNNLNIKTIHIVDVLASGW
jgi:L-lactate dehydrogenase complex protein LldE